ncbi:MAG: [acyl-carrier-protein] S-malonyltransferase [Bacteroidetes bacterium]|nr:MAG: [acyl-carrier-protein] S-malonyltransferase [Bacteroidota bacterium]
MKAYVFPGQGSQFPGMGKEEYESQALAKEMIDQANDVLGYRLSDVMFEGTADDLKETRITQPAIYVHSVMRARMLGSEFKPDVVAGHSLGEYSALTAAGALSFEDGLRLVYERAEAMQEACEKEAGTMAAIVGLEDEVIETVCAEVDGVVVAANYNCPGQLVISGAFPAVEEAVQALTDAGARRAILLEVGGAFHSPLMAPAQERLQKAIEEVKILTPICPIYQNVSALATTDTDTIKRLLIEQLTSPVRWTQTMQKMIADGVDGFVEVGGKGRILSGLVRRLDRQLATESV